jgi:hypothetical protein
MSDDPNSSRRRWITLGEIIAVAALIVSALGLWNSWQHDDERKGPTEIVEQKRAVPLVLLGTPEREGRTLRIAPVDKGHALESLTLIINGTAIDVGSDGRLDADAVESALKDSKKDSKSAPVRIDARYIENGAEREVKGTYRLRYRWEGGGLFGGRSLRLTGLTRG